MLRSTALHKQVSRSTACPFMGSRPARLFSSTSQQRREEISVEPGITAVSSQNYTAPLMKTVRNIKYFSLSSLGISALISPVFFIIDAEIEPAVRVAMVSVALSTSAVSTGIIQWVLKPYVTSGRHLNSVGSDKIELNRLSWLGRKTSTILETKELTVEKNGRMFSNLKTQDGDAFYVHETTKFWQDLTKDAQVSKSANQV